MAINLQWFGDRFLRYVDDRFEDRAHLAGRAMVQISRSLVPVDTGATKASIHYLYERKTRTLTLIASTHYSSYLEWGTFKMAARPYLRPALAAAAPIFGIQTNMMLGTSLSPDHTPLHILRHIRPRISAANARWNRGRVAKAAVTHIHMDRQGEALRHTAPTGHKFVVKSSASRLAKIKRAWN